MLIAIFILLSFAFGVALMGYIDNKKEDKDSEYNNRRTAVINFMIQNLYRKGKKIDQPTLDIIRGWSDHCAKYKIYPSDIRTQLIIKNLCK